MTPVHGFDAFLTQGLIDSFTHNNDLIVDSKGFVAPANTTKGV